MRRSPRFWLLACFLMLAVPLLMAQVQTYRIQRLGGGTSGKLAEVDSSGNLMVSTSGTVAAATDPGYQSFPKVRLAGGATGNLAEVDSSGHLLVSIGSGNTWSASQGGTGQTVYAVGDLLYADTATSLARLADVPAGSYVRSGGANTPPVWSTTTLPNSATAGDLLAASAANGYANVAAVAAGQVLASAGIGTLPAYTTSPILTTVTLSAGTGTATYKPSGVILTNTTTQATTGTSEETLASAVIPANTLTATGQSIRVTAYFSSAANTNSKTARLRWNGTGGTNIAAQTVATSGASVELQGVIIRTGAATQLLEGHGLGNAATQNTSHNTDTQTFNTDLTVFVRGTTATASGDLTFQALIVEVLP